MGPCRPHAATPGRGGGAGDGLLGPSAACALAPSRRTTAGRSERDCCHPHTAAPGGGRGAAGPDPRAACSLELAPMEKIGISRGFAAAEVRKRRRRSRDALPSSRAEPYPSARSALARRQRREGRARGRGDARMQRWRPAARATGAAV